jgi:hypothetical protein
MVLDVGVEPGLGQLQSRATVITETWSTYAAANGYLPLSFEIALSHFAISAASLSGSC